MSYYGTYATRRTSGSSGASYGLSTPSHSALPNRSYGDRSPGRTSKTSSQYLSPYSAPWEQNNLPPTKYSALYDRQEKSKRDHSSERSSRFSNYKLEYEASNRPHSSLGWQHQDIQRSHSPSYGFSDLGHSHERARSPGYRSTMDYIPKSKQKLHSPDYRLKYVTSRNTVWTDLSMRYPKTSRYSGNIQRDYNAGRYSSNDYTSVPDKSGWRAKLAQQGYVASTTKKNRTSIPERKWHYLDDSENEDENTEEFVYRTSQGTCAEDDEEINSVISRTRRMKLQMQSGKIATQEFSVQVDTEELEKYKEQEERRLKRSFISSRYNSWYDSGAMSYNRYLSPVPWRGSGSYYNKWSNKSLSSPTTESKELASTPELSETEASNKDFRKSVLNVDLPESEAQIFAKRQAETRWRKAVEDVCYTSEDGSPSETGYESHSSCTDADRSSGETESLFTDSLDRSYAYGEEFRGSSYRGSSRSTPFGDTPLGEYTSYATEVVDGETNAKSPVNNLMNSELSCYGSSTQEYRPQDNQENIDCNIHEEKTYQADEKNLSDLCFRFRPLSQEASQRDSGFSELCNQAESPYENIAQQQSPLLDNEWINKETANLSEDIHAPKLVCEFNDIDMLLLDENFNPTVFQTFEDFDRIIEREKTNIRTKMISNDVPKWGKPAKAGLRLDLDACNKFIGACHDIDEMLGQPIPMSPDSESTTVEGLEDIIPTEDEADCISTAATSIISGTDIANLSWVADSDQFLHRNGLKNLNELYQGFNHSKKLDDCTLQIYRYNGSEGDYGNYLDLESTIDEQAEDFEDFHQNRKNAIILRTQLSVRVHAIIEKLLNSTGRELRRALFSLKQIFQDDKDLVHEFVQNDGLACLIKVGSEADQNYQNYILRALGQVMLYVDGMNGVIEHIETIQWLYSLISSKYRLVVKTALKLLLVFVEYSESNSQLLMNTVCAVDSDKGTTPWSNIMNLLKEKDSADMELLVYAVTLINKTLNGIPDQDTYYDIVDNLEEQGMENVIQYYMSKQGTDLDLLQQFQIYEAVLKHEDGVPDTKPLPLDARFRQVPRRKSQCDESDRRKSRRHSVGTINSTTKPNKFHSRSLENTPEESPFTWQDRNQNHIGDTGKKANKQLNGHVNGNGINESCHDINGMTPALRKRRERDARNKSLIKEQEENSRGANYQRSDSLSSSSSVFSDSNETSPLVTEDKSYLSIVERHRSRFENHVDHENRKNSELSRPKDDKALNEERKKLCDSSRPNSLPYGLSSNNKKSWMLSMMYGKSQDEEIKSPSAETISNGVEIVNNNYIVYNKREDESLNSSLSSVKKDNSFKDMQEKFIYRNGDSSVRSPTSDNIPRIGDPSGIISRAKEGLAASKSIRPDSKPTSPLSPSSSFIQEIKKPETDLQWEQLIKSVKRPLIINDLDFTDLRSDEDVDLLESLGPEITSEMNGGPPPPPLPPGLGPPPPPPPLPLGGGPVPPPPPPQTAPPNKCGSRLNGIETPSVPPTWLKRNQHHLQEAQVKDLSKSNQKTKKTVKLFWREVKEDKSLLKKIGRKKTIWDELKPVPVDTQKLEHLFENRAKDIMNKEKSQDCVKKSEIIVLDTKRSNAINIGMTKLPPPRTIKTAILKMDSTIMNREGIEKILTMLPTEDEKSRIAEAQMNTPDVPLGTAEQFLLTLSSISELEARLRLWAFRLDYETMEREVAEPLMDLKQAMKEIESSETFRVILSTLRSVGNFLNGVEIKGFHIEYLSKVPEVKDTVQKHSLLHHLCHIVMEKFPKSSDLYSEIGSVTRASKIDYGEVTKSLNKMESECKASWDYLKAIAKHDCNITMKVRTSEFLTDCAERIIVLKVIHRRMINRYHKFLVYLGCTSQSIEELPIQKCCRILSEFALEYRTTRERVLQQIEKKANHRERNKTRGKMITDMERFRTKEQQADHELRQLLGNSNGHTGEEHKTQKWGTVPGIRGRVRPQLGSGGSLGRHSVPTKDDNLTDADDEILETLVKTATTQPARNEPRIRKKARYGDRKSLRRTLKGGLELSEEERHMLSSLTT